MTFCFSFHSLLFGGHDVPDRVAEIDGKKNTARMVRKSYLIVKKQR